MKKRGMDASAPKLPSVDEAIAHLRGAAQPGWHHGPGSRIGVRMLKEKIARLEAEVERAQLLVEAAEAYATGMKKPEAGPEHFVDQYGAEEQLGAAVLDAAAKIGGAR